MAVQAGVGPGRFLLEFQSLSDQPRALSFEHLIGLRVLVFLIPSGVFRQLNKIRCDGWIARELGGFGVTLDAKYIAFVGSGNGSLSCCRAGGWA
jgi:hypothetical protein